MSTKTEEQNIKEKKREEVHCYPKWQITVYESNLSREEMTGLTTEEALHTLISEINETLKTYEASWNSTK